MAIKRWSNRAIAAVCAALCLVFAAIAVQLLMAGGQPQALSTAAAPVAVSTTAPLVVPTATAELVVFTPAPTPSPAPAQTEPTPPPTAVPTPEPTAVPTVAVPTPAPVVPSPEPAETPAEGTEAAVGIDSLVPAGPTEEPTEEAVIEPTAAATEIPTEEPTKEPTSEPTEEPTSEPTAEPTSESETIGEVDRTVVSPGWMWVDTSDGLFLRGVPGGDILSALEDRSKVYATGRAVSLDDRLWMEIDQPAIGWVALEFVTADEPEAPEEKEPTGPSDPPTPADWEALRQCESGGRYDVVDPSGLYHGAYQFLPSTWDGLAARFRPELVGILPSQAVPADQDAMAYKLFELEGARPWPVCGQNLL